MTQWLAAAGNGDARLAYQGRENIAIDPVFFQWMDARIGALNEHGMVAAPVLIWDAQWNRAWQSMNPGNTLPDSQIILLAKYIVARYGAYQVIWILAGDGTYRENEAERWRKIGRAVFGAHPSRLATIHPGGQLWVGDEFRDEPWFSFVGYQSGHGDSDDDLRWLWQGPPAKGWKREPPRPVINLEPNYEGHNCYTHRTPFDAHAVRRAAYWSLLVSPPAGITYGGHGIWSWELQPAEPLNHPGTGMARPWSEAIQLPGSTDMMHLKTLFTSLDWWTLRPAPELVPNQPGDKDPSRFVAAAKSAGGNWALLYFPVGEPVTLNLESPGDTKVVRWYNPRSGAWASTAPVPKHSEPLTPPDENDWVAWLGPGNLQ